MVRIKNRDDLVDIRGKLGSSFRAANLTSLNVRFFVGHDTDRSTAAATLDHFFRVAGKLCSSENAFNRRARPTSGRPSLMTNLRGAAHLTALREFSAAKEAILGINANIGRYIVRLAERDIAAAARAPTLQPPKNSSLN